MTERKDQIKRLVRAIGDEGITSQGPAPIPVPPDNKLYARRKACALTSWGPGRWREVELIRTLTEKPPERCESHELSFVRGGGAGVPGEQIVQYADKPKEGCFETWFDYIWNVEIKSTLPLDGSIAVHPLKA